MYIFCSTIVYNIYIYIHIHIYIYNILLLYFIFPFFYHIYHTQPYLYPKHDHLHNWCLAHPQPPTSGSAPAALPAFSACTLGRRSLWAIGSLLGGELKPTQLSNMRIEPSAHLSAMDFTYGISLSADFSVRNPNLFN